MGDRMARTLVESARPLSESGLWDLLMTSYRESGPDAWLSGRIPQTITSNGQIADVYAAVAAGFLRDCAEADPDSAPLILEIGGGSGLFAWLFLHRLRTYREASGDHSAFEYLLTDAAASNVESWAAAPRLRRLMSDGPLRTGVLTVGDELSVRGADGAEWSEADLLSRPVLLIANYVLDSVPCDLMRIRGGVVMREWVGFETMEEDDPAGEEFQRLLPSFESRVVEAPYTGHPVVDRTLEGYRDLPGEPCIPVPIQAIEFLEPFLSTSHPFLMLAGDLAYTMPSFRDEPPILFRDYVACTVNFHMLGELFRSHGGGERFARYPDTKFSVGAFMRPGPSGRLGRTDHAAQLLLSEFTPHDAFNAWWGLRANAGSLDFRGLLAWLRLARHDGYTARLCIPQLLRIVTEAHSYDAELMRNALLESWRCDLPEVAGEGVPLDERIAFLFLSAGMHAAVHELLAESMAEMGESPARLHMLAIADERLGRSDEATHHLSRLVELKPDYFQGMPGSVDRPPSVENEAAHLGHLVLRASVEEFARMAESETGVEAIAERG